MTASGGGRAPFWGGRRMASLVVLALACCADPETHPAPGETATIDEGPVVGRYAGGVVTREELTKAAERMPPALRAKFDSPAGRRELVRSLIDKRLLVLEAQRRGFQDDPEIRRQVDELEERLVIKALLAAEEKAAPAPSQKELRDYYEAHKAELASAARVRLSRVLVKVAAGASDADRKRASLKAERLARLLGEGQSMAQIAPKGDGPERERGGDLGFLTGASGDPALERAALALRTPGELSPVIACAEGFAVLQLAERREGRVPSFEEARAEVIGRLAPHCQRKLFDDLLSRLRTSAEIQLTELAP